ncbi:MAG: hypothetical protein U7127_29165 [Phormidium sp.]
MPSHTLQNFQEIYAVTHPTDLIKRCVTAKKSNQDFQEIYAVTHPTFKRWHC